MTLRQIVRGLKEPRKILMYLLLKTAKMWSDEQFLKMLFPLRTGYKLNLKNPQTFNEKLQWLKLNNRKPEMVKMVDKVEAKEYVANIIGEEYIIPTLGVYNSVDEIDFDKLPNQFVLKCTHDSGGIVICSDKSKLDIDAAKAKLARGLKVNYYYQNREWPYKQVKPRIIAEQYMTDGMSNDLPDYKFFCFDGEPEYCQVIRDRHTKETIDFYDMQWNQMPFIGLNPVAGNGLTPVAKPTHLDKMIEICRKLSDGNPFSRIDLYVINNKEYFGEITFYPMSGMGKFTPGEWNNRLGDLINLPTPIGGGVNTRV